MRPRTWPRLSETRIRVSERLGYEAPPLPAGDAVASLLVEPATISLDGPARYAQVVVTAELASGAKVDVTREVAYSFSAPVASADSAGLVMPSANGAATLTVKLDDKSATVDVEVSNVDRPARPDFIRDIAPISGPRWLQCGNVPWGASREKRLQAFAPRLRPGVRRAGADRRPGIAARERGLAGR